MRRTMDGRSLLGLTLAAATLACQGSIGAPEVPPLAGLGGPQKPNPSNPGQPNPSNPSNPNPSNPANPMPTTPPGPVDACAGQTAPSSGPAPIRRLSNTEWRWSLIDLLGTAQATRIHRLADGLQAATESLGFQNNADFLDVPPVLAQQYMDASEELATEVGTSLVTCDPGASSEQACARAYVESLGRRAYRRPLTAEELARFDTVYTEARAEGGFDMAIEWLTFAMLQSPSFLYRAELGSGRPTGYEMASRLSYFFWHSVPDEALLTAAASGALDTPDGVRIQAERLLDDQKATRITRFFAEWLDTDRLQTFQRDAAIFPGLDARLAERFQRETDAFVQYVLFDPAGDGKLSTLFEAPYTFADAALARHYGLAGVTGNTYQKVDVDPAQRRGLLTQGGVLTVHDKPSRTSIVRRGLKIRTDLLCQTIGSPPDDVELDLPDIGPGLTQKQRLEQHRTNQSCAGCHNLMDPLGVALDQLDAVGRFRTDDEHGTRIDARSEITNTTDANGPVEGPAELAMKLAHSDQVSRCFVTQLFRYAHGRRETAADACTRQRLEAAFVESGDIRELLVNLTQTDAFLHRP